MGQLDLANASLAAAAAGGAISPSMLAAQGKIVLPPSEAPALAPSMAQRRLVIEQLQQRVGAGAPATSGGQSTEEMTATEEERLKPALAAPADPVAAAHSFGSSGVLAAFYMERMLSYVPLLGFGFCQARKLGLPHIRLCAWRSKWCGLNHPLSVSRLLKSICRRGSSQHWRRKRWRWRRRRLRKDCQKARQLETALACLGTGLCDSAACSCGIRGAVRFHHEFAAWQRQSRACMVSRCPY